jgi:hypothetical protein
MFTLPYTNRIKIFLVNSLKYLPKKYKEPQIKETTRRQRQNISVLDLDHVNFRPDPDKGPRWLGTMTKARV